jgi:hypothetical protein
MPVPAVRWLAAYSLHRLRLSFGAPIEVGYAHPRVREGVVEHR